MADDISATKRPSRGLSASKNPQARMQELLQKGTPEIRERAEVQETEPKDTFQPTLQPTLQASNEASKVEGNQDTNKESNLSTFQDTEQTSKVETLPERHLDTLQPSKQGSNLESMIETLKDTPLVAVNFRIPDGMNDWLDAQAFRLKKSKVTKQDLVKRALELLVREMEAGTDQ